MRRDSRVLMSPWPRTRTPHRDARRDRRLVIRPAIRVHVLPSQSRRFLGPDPVLHHRTTSAPSRCLSRSLGRHERPSLLERHRLGRSADLALWECRSARTRFAGPCPATRHDGWRVVRDRDGGAGLVLRHSGERRRTSFAARSCRTARPIFSVTGFRTLRYLVTVASDRPSSPFSGQCSMACRTV